MQSEQGETISLLLVDDRDENLKTLAAVLDDLGENLVFANSGSAALKSVLQMDFAAILMDVRMPGMDGMEAASLIRRRDRSAHTPIIFLTAFGEDIELVKEGYKLGAVDFLHKPIVPEILRSKVAVFVDLYRKSLQIQRAAESLRESERRAHEQEMEDEKRRWEAQKLREEVDRERENAARLQESYDRLHQLEQLRDDLTGMIIHDLRTPLASLITGLELMESMGDLNVEQVEMLHVSISSGRNLLRLISNLLDVSKMESGFMLLDYEVVHPEDLVSEAIEQVTNLARFKEIDLQRHSPSRVGTVYGDPDKLSRALVNLLGNGIQYTPRGGKVTVGVEQDGAFINFWVKDSGEGIPSDAIERIFEKFGQVENRKAGHRMSTGLGLTFCKMVAEAHRGHIRVDSAAGKGSTFTIGLPLDGRESK